MNTVAEACTRWIELSDREAVGEPLRANEAEFFRAHPTTCLACSREATAFRSLSASVLEAVPSDEEVEQLIRAAALAPSAQEPRRAGRVQARSIMAVAAGVSLAAAAAVVLVARGPDAEQSGSPAQQAARPASPRPAPERGAAPAAAQPTDAPAARWVADAGPSCRVVLGDVTLCLDSGAEADTARLNGNAAVLELRRGRAVAALPKRPEGASFAITTASGSVTAIGTIFSVEIGEAGSTVARVARGEVAVVALGAEQAIRLRAGHSLTLGAPDSIAPLEVDEEARDLALLPTRVTESKPKPLEPQVEAPAARSPGTDPLGQARLLRARGDIAGAAKLYESIHASGPQSASGRAALLALGELRLSDLGDAAGALKAFDRYLSGSSRGPLVREAEYGRIRALRALGQRRQESMAIERFLKAYPDGPEAHALRRRLDALHD